MLEIIKNCPITNEDSMILKKWMDEDPIIHFGQQVQYHTGIDLTAHSVYVPFNCVCTYTGYGEDDKNVVIVQYDKYRSFRFANLSSVAVKGGDILDKGTQIGDADEYVHFEYLNRKISQWVVRVGHEEYYKHDPIEYARGDIDLDLPVQTYTWYIIDPEIETNVEYGYMDKLQDGEATFHLITSTRSTAFQRKFGKRLDPKADAYICVPYTYKNHGMTADDIIGLTVAIKDSYKGTEAYAIIGDISVNSSKWLNISQYTASMLGYEYSEMTSNNIRSNFIIYFDPSQEKIDWTSVEDVDAVILDETTIPLSAEQELSDGRGVDEYE